MPQNELVEGLGLDEYQYGFVDEEAHVFRTRPGLDEDIVRQISKHKEEPEWMLEFRLKALKIYESKPMPTWGGDLSDLEATLDEIYFYVKPTGPDGAILGRRPGEHQEHVRALGHPRGGAKDSGRRWRAVRVRDGISLPQGGVGFQGRDLRFDRRRAQESPGALPRAFRDCHLPLPTTSSRPSTRLSGRAGRSSTCRRA